MKKTYFYLFIFLIAVACQNDKNVPEKIVAEAADNLVFSPTEMQTANVVLGKVEQQNVSETIKTNGIFDIPPQNMAAVGIFLGGFVKKTDMLVGNYVQEGETLAVLEHLDYLKLQQSYIEAKANLTFSEKEFTRQQDLRKNDLNALQTLEKAENALQIAKVQTSSLAQQLKLLGYNPATINADNLTPYVTLKAPFNGYITEMNISIGKYVAQNEVIFKMINKNHLHLELQVFEKDVFKLKEGQKITFRLTNIEEKSFGATVFLIGQVFDSHTKTVNVHAHLDQEDSRFKVGMFVEATIQLGENLQDALPETAFVQEDNQTFCFVFEKIEKNKDTVFKKIAVEIGNTENGFTAIKLPDNLKNATFAKNGAYYLNAKINKETSEE